MLLLLLLLLLLMMMMMVIARQPSQFSTVSFVSVSFSLATM